MRGKTARLIPRVRPGPNPGGRSPWPPHPAPGVLPGRGEAPGVPEGSGRPRHPRAQRRAPASLSMVLKERSRQPRLSPGGGGCRCSPAGRRSSPAWPLPERSRCSAEGPCLGEVGLSVCLSVPSAPSPASAPAPRLLPRGGGGLFDANPPTPSPV